MNKRINAGADIHAGDGGYEISTQEKYEAFVKVRNKSLAQARIRELAEQAAKKHGHTIRFSPEITETLDSFAELIVQECADTVLGFHNQFGDSAHREIREHFGVES